MNSAPPCAIIVFVKNSEAGKVKTRLAASVGNERALQIYQQLVSYTLHLVDGGSAAKYIYFSDFVPDEFKSAYPRLIGRVQVGETLGERMQNAFLEVLTTVESCAIIGSDCAELTPATLTTCFESLQYADTCIGPSIDGGYYLLGLKKMEEFLFNDMEWSTPKVFQTSMKRLLDHGNNVKLLPRLRDVDTEDDWKKLQWGDPELARKLKLDDCRRI